jgi:fusion and transport protein UGO1
MPLFVRNWFRIDPIDTPTAYSVTSFLIALGDLFVKLPLETVLRRGHVAYLRGSDGLLSPTLPLHTAGLGQNKFRTIIPVGPYKGIVGTFMSIVNEEGFRDQVTTAGKQVARRRRKGQGMKGLWRGWRVGFWALVGMWWTQAAMTGNYSGGEL